MNYEEALNEALNRRKDIELALNESSIVAITNRRGIIQFANDKLCEVSKYSAEELVGRDHRILNAGYHNREFFKEMWGTIGRGNLWKGEIKNRAKDGTYYWVDTTIVPFLNEKNRPYQYIAIRHEITKLKTYEKKIEQMAYYDPLTSLPNRNFLSKQINQQLLTDHLSVLFLDIDRFKSINDTFGHHTGDVLLKKIAKRLKKSLQSDDIIMRQGGDEFIVILNDTVNKDEIITMVNTILEKFTIPFMINGNRIFVTTSIGISTHASEKGDMSMFQLIDILIRQADIAMYYAKRQGDNTYCFNTDEQNEKIQRYYKLKQEIKHALHDKQFSVVYQPLIKLNNNEIVGVEALLRWNNPKFGTVRPTEFIPILEELGEIYPVGQWVLKKVCEQMKEWQDQKIPIERASVNISPLQFRNDHFVSNVKKILIETGLDPNDLELEITENAILPMDKAEQILHELRDLGVHISIDDFGTGYSSLSYLKNLPIHTLKIDKSFIHDLNTDEEVIVNTIITMGKNFDFNVLAEGIETKEQLNFLKSKDCHEGQGFYFSKPVSADEIVELVKAQSL